MKKTRHAFLVLLSSLLIMLTGCDRREILDDYPVSGVRVKLNWTGVTGKLPEGARVIFYPKDAEGRKIDRYLRGHGGDVLKVPPGRYSVVVYNYDAETVLIRGEEAYEMIEAYAAPCRGLELKDGLVWTPEPFYAAQLEDLDIKKSDEVLDLEFQLKLTVQSYTFEIPVKGLKNVSSITGNVSGLDVCYPLGNHDCSACPSFPVFFEGDKDTEVIKGRFSAFGPLAHIAARAGVEVMLRLDLLKIDGKTQTVEVNITEVMTPPDPPEGGGGTSPGPPEVVIEIPLDDLEIEDVVPGPGEGGGIGGDVGDWGPEDNVELPVK